MGERRARRVAFVGIDSRSSLLETVVSAAVTLTTASDDAHDDSGGTGVRSESGFALFENPRSESVASHVSDHWRDVRVARFGDETAETRHLLLSCDRCEVRYWLEDVPAERVPGTRKFEELGS